MGSVERPLQEPWKLYVMHLCFSFVSRVWDMGIALLLAKLTNNSLFIVALTGFMCSLSVFLFGSTLGSLLDRTDRLSAMVVALGVKLVGVTMGYGICAWLLFSSSTSTAEGGAEVVTISPALSWLIYSIPLVNALAHLSFSMVNLAVEKDWVVVLAAKDGAWLSRTNAVMSQLDMACAALAPLVTGVIFDVYSGGAVAVLLLVCNAVVTIAFYWFVRLLYYSFPSLQLRGDGGGGGAAAGEVEVEVADPETGAAGVAEEAVAREASESTPLLPTRSDAPNNSGTANANSATSSSSSSSSSSLLQCCLCEEFLSRSGGCAGVMLSYAFLYLTVLSFGPLMTVYLVWAGVSLPWIGVLRGCSAMSGFVGATLFPLMTHRIGVWQTGQLSIVYQCLLVAVAAGSLVWYAVPAADPAAAAGVEVVNPDMQFPAFFLAFLVVFSRAGLWAFDLSARQIAQQCIPEAYRGRVNGQWKSVIGLFDMTSFAIACVFSDPGQFVLLTAVSATMVLLATVSFTAANFSYHRAEAGLPREPSTCPGMLGRSMGRVRTPDLLQEETLLQNNDYVDNFSKQSRVDVSPGAAAVELADSAAVSDRGAGRSDALFGRKDNAYQSRGSVLGDGDPNPAVVRSRAAGGRANK